MNESVSQASNSLGLKDMACPYCGNRSGMKNAIAELDKLIVTCEACGTPFISEIGEKLFTLEKEKTDKLKNCWLQLNPAIAFDDDENIKKFAEEILDINPDDYKAKYYKAYGNFKSGDISGYLMDFYQKGIERLATQAELEEILAHINGHIEVAHYEKVRCFVEKCGNHLDEFSSKVSQYEAAYKAACDKRAEYECVKKDVFLCYSEDEDLRTINQIASSLKLSGISVWQYSVNLDPRLKKNKKKRDKLEQIEAAIEGCDVFLYVLSEKFAALTDKKKEIQHAVKHHKKCFEICIKRAALPIDVKDVFSVDGTKNLNTALGKLKPAIKGALGEMIEVAEPDNPEVPGDGEVENGGNTSVSPVCISNDYYEITKDLVLKRVDLSITHVKIPDGVRRIDDKVFKSHNIKKVEIPASVETLGVGVFKSCKMLETVKIASSSKLKSIPDDTFNGCEFLSAIELPKGITEIGKRAFCGCSKLNKITFKESSKLESIGEKAFSFCTRLEEIKIPKTVTKLGKDAFEYCGFNKALIIPENVERIPGGLCYSCTKLHEVSLPANSKNIGPRAFECCSSLEIIAIPDGVVKIESRAFKDCTMLRAVNISTSSKKKKIAADAFSECEKLYNTEFARYSQTNTKIK